MIGNLWVQVGFQQVSSATWMSSQLSLLVSFLTDYTKSDFELSKSCSAGIFV